MCCFSWSNSYLHVCSALAMTLVLLPLISLHSLKCYIFPSSTFKENLLSWKRRFSSLLNLKTLLPKTMDTYVFFWLGLFCFFHTLWRLDYSKKSRSQCYSRNSNQLMFSFLVFFSKTTKLSCLICLSRTFNKRLLAWLTCVKKCTVISAVTKFWHRTSLFSNFSIHVCFRIKRSKILRIIFCFIVLERERKTCHRTFPIFFTLFLLTISCRALNKSGKCWLMCVYRHVRTGTR